MNAWTPRFTRAEILFSVKSFAASMLAVYLASRAGLPRPFWAMMTTYVVAHPLAGAVRSKAVYRFAGTLVGSLVTVLLVPALSNAPELLSLVLALWVGLCLYISLLDRTPQAYMFMLAGYTAALIGFPAVEAPQAIFDTAIARVQEIGLGIFCATLVHSLVLPTTLTPTIMGLLDRTQKDARLWFADLLSGQRGGKQASEAEAQALANDRRRLAGDITQLRLLSTHVPFDTTHLRWTAGAIRAMQDRVAALTPTLSAVEDRLRALHEAEGDLAPDITDLLARVAQWLQAHDNTDGKAQPRTAEEDEAELHTLLEAIRSLGMDPIATSGDATTQEPAQAQVEAIAPVALASDAETSLAQTDKQAPTSTDDEAPSLRWNRALRLELPTQSSPGMRRWSRALRIDLGTSQSDYARPWQQEATSAETSLGTSNEASAQASERPQSAQRWNQALRIALAGRLEDLIHGWRACLRLRRDIDAGLTGAAVPLRRTALQKRVLHLDYGMAALSSLAAIISILLCCAFWILTGWSQGSAAAMMAAIFCSFFASMDDPVPAIHGFLYWTLYSIPVSALYVLVLLPPVQDFGMLVAVCAPTFLLLGMYVARASTFAQSMAFLFGVAGTLALHDTSTADLSSFLNGMLGQAIGIIVAARITRLMRSVGADWAARRIQRATWRELAEMAAAPRGEMRDPGYAARMLDRTGLLAPRIAQAGGRIEGVLAQDVLRDLRVGADITALQRARTHLPASLSTGLLNSVAGFFRARGAGRMVERPAALLPLIDTTLAAILRLPENTTAARAAVTALVGLRRNFFPEAPATLAAQGATP